MKIKMLKTAAGPLGSYISGREYSGVGAMAAKQLIDAGAAVEIKAALSEADGLSEALETADDGFDVETAEAPKAKAKAKAKSKK